MIHHLPDAKVNMLQVVKFEKGLNANLKSMLVCVFFHNKMAHLWCTAVENYTLQYYLNKCVEKVTKFRFLNPKQLSKQLTMSRLNHTKKSQLMSQQNILVQF